MSETQIKRSARVIVIKGNYVLLISRNKHGEIFYTIPGGKCKKGESNEEAAIREFMEETSIEVRLGKYLGCFGLKDKYKEQHLFAADYVKGIPRLGDSTEKVRMKKDPEDTFEPVWITKDKALETLIRPDSCSEFFKEYISSNMSV